MISPQWDDRLRLPNHHLDVRWIARRRALDAGARLAELLPDEDSQAVARVVERYGFDQAAAPDAEEVHVGVRREPEQMRQAGGSRDAVKRVDRYPVPACDRDSAAVDRERVRPRARGRAIIREDLDAAEADRDVPLVEETLGPDRPYRQPMEGGRAVAVRPPEGWRGHVELEDGLARPRRGIELERGLGGRATLQVRLDPDGHRFAAIEPDLDADLRFAEVGR